MVDATPLPGGPWMTSPRGRRIPSDRYAWHGDGSHQMITSHRGVLHRRQHSVAQLRHHMVDPGLTSQSMHQWLVRGTYHTRSRSRGACVKSVLRSASDDGRSDARAVSKCTRLTQAAPVESSRARMAHWAV